MNRRRRVFVTNILIAMDALVVLGSFLFTYFFREQLHRLGMGNLPEFSYYFPYMLWVLVIWLILLKVLNCYSLTEGGGFLSQRMVFLKLLLVEILGLAILSIPLYFFRERDISRSFLVFFGLINLFALTSFKLLTFLFFTSIGINKKYHRKVLIAGNKDMVSQFLATSASMPELLIDPDVNPDFVFGPQLILSGKDWRNLSEGIIGYIVNHVIDEILLVFHSPNLTLAAPLINECRRLGIMVNFTLDTSEISYPKTEMDKIGPFNILSFQSYDYSPAQRFLKRVMDMTGGLVGCVIFAAAYIFLAPLIKLTSPGPALFIQTRKGKNGREFKLYKFRTMYADAEERKKEFLARNEMKGHLFKLKDDPRITPLGKFLRRTSVDELPQFINILKGHMSLVGTRPPTVEEFDAYENQHRRRLSIKPGLTGLWQVSGRNEIFDFEEVVRLDSEYIDKWSIWLDIKIILKTFTVLFKGR
ncbi:MAG: sugar transferase [Treponema sp.]|jgi:exopolysaccharide biosynthesis polyprenyl glycosylphosphotransferase|nr:sugar transferase [Treponema sp.]